MRTGRSPSSRIGGRKIDFRGIRRGLFMWKRGSDLLILDLGLRMGPGCSETPMNFMDLRDSLATPFVGLLMFAGIALIIKLGPLPLRYLFPGFKILTGSLDERSRGNRLSPSQAFAAGTATSLVPGSAVGASLAYLISGAGILPWIFFSALVIMPILFGASALAVRFRSPAGKGIYLCGPSLYVEKSLRARWFSQIISLILILASSVTGLFLPFLFFVTAIRGRYPWIQPLTVSVSLALVTAGLLTGGIGRIGRTARKLAPWALVAGIIGSLLFLFDSSQTGSMGGFVLRDLWNEIVPGWIPRNAREGSRLILALAVYHAFSETGNGKLATLSGAVRTNLPAKQGFAAMTAPLISALVVAPLSVAVSLYVHHQGLSIQQDPGALLFGDQYGNSDSAGLFLLISVILFLIPGFAGWAYSAGQSARYLSGEIGQRFYYILYIGILAASGLILEMHILPRTGIILELAAILAMITALFPLLAIVLLRNTVAAELADYEISRREPRGFMEELALLILVLLPKNTLSRISGWMARIYIPPPFRELMIGGFARFYRINLEEAEHPVSYYRSLNHFFTRHLKEGVRPIAEGKNLVVSPVDCHITQFGRIQAGRIIQAKDIDYSMEDLIDRQDLYKHYYDGTYAVLYLSPQDYHRIHSPVDGKILGYGYSPGKLFTVNRLSVDGVHGLFPKNERLVTYLSHTEGTVCLIKVGATNVGKIRINYDRFSTNQWIRIPRSRNFDRPIKIKKGEELGRFEMGSTVILLFEKDVFSFRPGLKSGDTLKLGEPLGEIRHSKTVDESSRPEKKNPR